MKIFVPGRICLFGEHSDWAGGYRRINARLEKGYTIITGTNQGIYAEVEPHPAILKIKTTLSDGTRNPPFECPMNPEALLHEAQTGGFYSYAAGVAYQILTHYRVRGLSIDNYKMDLPIKKGLSSSAAICVLVARAFNRIYDLKMTIRGEMEFAYLGEITTPSRCGRMDQGCAYGNRPILMIFDGERIEIQELKVKKDLFYILVDLGAQKDTMEILSRLNQAYPFANDSIQEKVQSYLGPINAGIVNQAAKRLQEGDVNALGDLMNQAQDAFDEHLKPACPSQLTAPVLHSLLKHRLLKPHILGGKGVGSQGDGSAQLLVGDEKIQEKVIKIIETKLKMSCLGLVVRAARGVRKAVIPAAGFGTRLFPASKVVKKELFPLIDAHGQAKPVILVIVEEAMRAGIEEICIVVQESDRGIFEEFFHMPPKVENYNKLSIEDKKLSDAILDLGHRIHFTTQQAQEGFGHAVFCAKDWVGDEPFLLMLGDHVYASETEISCSKQLVDVYERVGHNVIGVKVTAIDDIGKFGCVTGIWEEKNRLLNLTSFVEKPDPVFARDHLHIEGMNEDEFLTVFGQYVLSPKIFTYLEDHINHNVRERGEFQLTSCLERLRQEELFTGYVVQGKRFDIGQPEAYRKTLMDFNF